MPTLTSPAPTTTTTNDTPAHSTSHIRAPIQRPPKVLLFDIGGVCVLSPMSAIAAYEHDHAIPPGWINTAISRSGEQGAWARLERGEVALDEEFFRCFKDDLQDACGWAEFCAKAHARRGGVGIATGTGSLTTITAAGTTNSMTPAQRMDAPTPAAPPPPPPPPEIDATRLFWNMMGHARTPDPHVYPALRRLRARLDAQGGRPSYVLAACSNTVIWPATHAYADESTVEGRFNAALRGLFDVFVSSAHVGRRKPERRMFEFTLGECERVGRVKEVLGQQETLRPDEVLFFDDIGSNLRGGREVGIRGVKVVMGRTREVVEVLERETGWSLSERHSKL